MRHLLSVYNRADIHSKERLLRATGQVASFDLLRDIIRQDFPADVAEPSISQVLAITRLNWMKRDYQSVMHKKADTWLPGSSINIPYNQGTRTFIVHGIPHDSEGTSEASVIGPICNAILMWQMDNHTILSEEGIHNNYYFSDDFSIGDATFYFTKFLKEPYETFWVNGLFGFQKLVRDQISFLQEASDHDRWLSELYSLDPNLLPEEGIDDELIRQEVPAMLKCLEVMHKAPEISKEELDQLHSLSLHMELPQPLEIRYRYHLVRTFESHYLRMSQYEKQQLRQTYGFLRYWYDPRRERYMTHRLRTFQPEDPAKPIHLLTGLAHESGIAHNLRVNRT